VALFINRERPPLRCARACGRRCGGTVWRRGPRDIGTPPRSTARIPMRRRRRLARLTGRSRRPKVQPFVPTRRGIHGRRMRAGKFADVLHYRHICVSRCRTHRDVFTYNMPTELDNPVEQVEPGSAESVPCSGAFGKPSVRSYDRLIYRLPASAW